MLIDVTRFVFQELGDGWIAELQWNDGDYQGGPATIWIHPVEEDSSPHGGLSSTVLRSIDFRAAKAELQRKLADDPHGWRGSPEKRKQWSDERVARIRDELAKGVSAEYLAMLASEYVREVGEGTPKPVELLAGGIGKSVATIRGHLWQARKRGLLTGSAGRKGGDLTIEAMTILQRMQPPDPKRDDR